MRNNNMLDALFPRTRQAVLAALLLQTERRWYLSDLAQYLRVTPSSLQRELASLAEAGILKRERDGNRVYYQANPDFPLLPELQSLCAKTIGLADKITAVLEPFLAQVEFAFIFGSIARGERTAHSDVDLMLIGSVRLADLSLPLRELEAALGTPINVVLFSREEFAQKVSEKNHFVHTLLRERKIFLKGSEHELADAVGEPEDQAARREPAGA